MTVSYGNEKVPNREVFYRGKEVVGPFNRKTLQPPLLTDEKLLSTIAFKGFTYEEMVAFLSGDKLNQQVALIHEVDRLLNMCFTPVENISKEKLQYRKNIIRLILRDEKQEIERQTMEKEKREKKELDEYLKKIDHEYDKEIFFHYH